MTATAWRYASGVTCLLTAGFAWIVLASANPPIALGDSPVPLPPPAPGQVIAGRTTITLPDTSKYSPTERHILALERERSAAIARADTTWLAQLYAPDFEAVVGNGRRIARPDLFRIFGRDDPTSMFAIDELAVRGYLGAATVTGRLRFLTMKGTVAAETRYLHVYVERDGHWWIVRAQATLVPAADKP